MVLKNVDVNLQKIEISSKLYTLSLVKIKNPSKGGIGRTQHKEEGRYLKIWKC